VLTHSVASNHGFADGNKRTALILVDLLLTNSGYRLVPQPNESLNDAVEAMAVATVTGDLSLAGLTNWFKLRIEKI
jgi:death on curing protein